MKTTPWFIFFLFLAISCLDEPDCFQLNNNLIGVTFRVIGTGGIDTVSLTGVTLSGTQYYSGVTATGFELPLNLQTEQTDIVFLYPDGTTRSLALGYSFQKQFVSEDCGTRFILSNIEVLGQNAFDSIRVVNSTPGKTASNNIEIFRCPQTDILTVAFRQLYVNGTGTGTSQYRTSALNSITPEFLGVAGYTDTTATTIYLPVNLSAPTTTYTFDFAEDFKGSEPLTLTVDYTLTKELRYNRCDSQVFVSRLRPGITGFDSVSLVVDSDGDTLNTLLDPPKANLHVYRCPITNLAQFSFRQRIAGSPNPRQDTVNLKSIRTNYSSEVFYEDIDSVTTIQLPLNPAATNTIFYIEYKEGTMDTLSLAYAIGERDLFKACPDRKLISDLSEAVDNPNVVPVAGRGSIQFPPITNFEIFHN